MCFCLTEVQKDISVLSLEDSSGDSKNELAYIGRLYQLGVGKKNGRKLEEYRKNNSLTAVLLLGREINMIFQIHSFLLQ